jgi:hypothetical protein
MSVNTIIRRVVPVVALAALIISVSSCSSTKKYGCPNKLQISAFIK